MAAPTSNNEVTARRLTRLLTGSDGNGGLWGKIKDKLTGKSNITEGVYYVVGTHDYPAWVANHAYAVNDTVNYNSQIRVCKTAHTSGSSYDSSKWNNLGTVVLKGTIDGITALYAGLKISYKWPCYGGGSSTYLNINGLGNAYIYRNTGHTTTHLPPGTVSILTYDGTYWKWADYDSNTNNWVTTMGAYCDTAAATAAKVATSTNTVLTAGMSFLIRIVNSNTSAGKLTLNINSQGAKDVWINGVVSSASNYTLPAGEHWCHYDGSVFHIWTNGTAQFKGVHAESYEAKYLTDANLAIPPYIITSTTGGANADFVVSYTGSHIPDANYNWHIHSIVFREATNYRLTQIATASSSIATSLTYERNAWSSNGTTWTFAAWTEILTSNSTVAAGKISGTVATATTATTLGSSTLGSSTKPIYLSSGAATECSTYAGGTAVTLNNASKAASTASFYAPTAGGTANYVLIGNGTTSAPTWAEKAPKATTADKASVLIGTYSGSGGALAPSSISQATVRAAMMNKPLGLTAFNTYCDCILMDTYNGSDVPYVTGLGISKNNGNPKMYIFNGAKGNTTTWAHELEVLTTASTIVASKISTTEKIGDANKGVYVAADGTVTAMSYEVNKTVPSNAVFTDTNVTQTNTDTSSNVQYRLLMSATADDTTRTEGARKSTYAWFNPSTQTLGSQKFNIAGQCVLNYDTTTSAVYFTFS